MVLISSGVVPHLRSSVRTDPTSSFIGNTNSEASELFQARLSERFPEKNNQVGPDSSYIQIMCLVSIPPKVVPFFSRTCANLLHTWTLDPVLTQHKG